MIDLHTHTTASDGTLSPSKLIEQAKAQGLEAVAVTDHDTVEGIAEAVDAGREHGLEVVPGIEISAEYAKGTLHILGYYINSSDERFRHAITVLQKARLERNPKMIHNLQKLGFNITMEDVARQAETGQVGRPHFAQVLVQKGYVRSAQQAFDKYLKKGAAAYEEKFRFTPAEAISHIAACGGIAVLAHPCTLNYGTGVKLESMVSEMMQYGLQGIEVYYTDHSRSQTALYERIADKFSLLITGGSDFHGYTLNGVALGTGRGTLKVPYELLKKMKKALPDKLHDYIDNSPILS